jgi:hypothetical protein
MNLGSCQPSYRCSMQSSIVWSFRPNSVGVDDFCLAIIEKLCHCYHRSLDWPTLDFPCLASTFFISREDPLARVSTDSIKGLISWDSSAWWGQ